MNQIFILEVGLTFESQWDSLRRRIFFSFYFWYWKVAHHFKNLSVQIRFTKTGGSYDGGTKVIMAQRRKAIDGKSIMASHIRELEARSNLSNISMGRYLFAYLPTNCHQSVILYAYLVWPSNLCAYVNTLQKLIF